MSNIEQKYAFIVMPQKYICVYHYILILFAELGEDLLKDCKASCTNKNKDVVNCYNMFIAAVSAYNLGQTTLANTLIKFIKAKIEQLFKKYKDNISFTLPVDETGSIVINYECTEDEVTSAINPNIIQELDDIYVNKEDLPEMTSRPVLLTKDSMTTTKWYSTVPFVAGSSLVFLNGLRYFIDDDDYRELPGEAENTSIGIELNSGSFDESDEIYVLAELVN